MSADARPGADAQAGVQVSIALGWATQHNVQDGDLHVHQGVPPNYQVDEFRPQRRSVPRSVRRQPSRSLAARHQVVDFTGRDHELAELADWRDDPDLGLAVQLVHGPGGQGKTRLAAQFAQCSAELGWTVAHAVRRSYDTVTSSGLDAAQVASSCGLLVIVDYAERWPVGDLLALAQDPLLRTGVPTRVLLLARPAGGWWDNLSYLLEDRYGMVTDQMPLTALADTVATRTTVFTGARDRFAELLGVPEPRQIPPPIRLSEDAFGLVLTVHMAALVAVEAYIRGDTPPANPAALSAYLLKRERAHWQSMFDDDPRAHTRPEMMAWAVFTAILTRPLPYFDALSVLQRVAIPDPGQVLDDHRLYYPPTDPATVCEPLYPDQLGEDFLALQIPGHALTGYQPDPWADTAVARLLTGTDNRDGDQRPPAYTPQAVTVLIETARRWPHITRCQLFPLLRAQPGLAVAAGGAALARLAEFPDVDLGVLATIASLLPTGRHVDFDVAASVIISRLTTHSLAATSDPAHRARLYTTLGYRLTYAGRREEALAATSKAVELYRWLAGVNPTFQPDLARVLNNLGAMFCNLGRWEDALGATVESVEVYRQLAGQNSAAFESDLAMALNNFSGILSNLGRWEKALTAASEAVEIRRRSVGVNPASFEPDLATALITLGGALSNLGRWEDALGAMVDALEVYRRLATVNPAAFKPDLATALNNLSIDLSNLGRWENALAAVSEAVEIRRRLVVVNPAAFERDLATALTNLGVRLSDLGRREEALATVSEAVELYRRLAEVNPAGFKPGLAGVLNNLSVELLDLRRYEEALATTGEAVELYRRLAEVNPAAFEPGLASALNNLGRTLSNLGRREEALDATREAVEIRRRLVELNPRAFEPGLANALESYAWVRAAGQVELPQALSAAEESVAIYEGMVQQLPQAFISALRGALATLADLFDGLGRSDEAAQVRQRIDRL